MSNLIRVHCLLCEQTYFTTDADLQQCDLCRKVGGLVSPRDAPVETPLHPQPQDRPKGGYPVSRSCPTCGRVKFRTVRPDGLVAFTHDRVCTMCGTRYTPPTPLWGAWALIVTGIVMLLMAIAGGVLSTMAVDACALAGEAFVAVLGGLAVIQGIRGLSHPKEAAASVETGTAADRPRE